MLSTLVSICFTSSVALFKSAISKPFCNILSSKICCGFAPLALNAEKTLLKYLSSFELLNSIFFPLVAAALIALPAPYTKGVTNIDSLPNFNLLNNFLDASALSELVSSSLSNCVGPPNKSPNVPILSTSATNASPAAPPVTPAANLFAFAFLFRSDALPAAFIKFGFLKLT